MRVINETTREQYLGYRQNNEQFEILRIWFNRMSELELELDEANFFQVMFTVLEEHPGLQQDIDQVYPQIVLFYDKFLNINFLTKQLGDTRKLIMMY